MIQKWSKNGPILDLGWFEWVERYFVCLSLIRNLALPEVISFFFVSINIYPEMSLSWIELTQLNFNLRVSACKNAIENIFSCWNDNIL